jgi:hypothetical protein
MSFKIAGSTIQADADKNISFDLTVKRSGGIGRHLPKRFPLRQSAKDVCLAALEWLLHRILQQTFGSEKNKILKDPDWCRFLEALFPPSGTLTRQVFEGHSASVKYCGQAPED